MKAIQSPKYDGSKEDHCEDDFTWQQDNNEEFLFGPNSNTKTKAKVTSSHDSNRNATNKNLKEPKKEPPVDLNCRFCEKKFSYKNNLKLHETEVHTKTFRYFCDFCNRGHVRKDRLLEHLHSQHLKIRPYCCSVCGFAFTLQKNLKAHMEFKHSDAPNEKYRCVHCTRIMANARSLRNHLMLHSGFVCFNNFVVRFFINFTCRERNFVCELCAARFITRTKLKIHRCHGGSLDKGDIKVKFLQDDNKEQYFARYCRYCDSSFSTWDEKNSHQCPYLQNVADPKFYICRFCNKQVTKNSFRMHISVHAEPTHECKHCLRLFKSIHALKQHVKIHTESKKFKCDRCERSWSKKDGLISHLAKQHGTQIETFDCQTCGNSFLTETKLKAHQCPKTSSENIESDSKKMRQYCRYCDTIFSTWASKDLHQCLYLKNASDSKHYICKICSKEIAKSSFRCHANVHVEASHECPVCKKIVKSKKILKQHIKTHDQKNKHRCSQCDKSYSTQEILIAHEGKKHNRPVPVFSCDKCSKTFLALYRLKVHKKQFHEIDSTKKSITQSDVLPSQDVAVIQSYETFNMAP